MLAVNAVRIDTGALDFACYIARLTNSGLTGLFLENLVEDEKLTVRKAYDGTYIYLDVDENSPEYLAKMEAIGKNIEVFNEVCSKNGIRSNVCKDRERPLDDIIEESRFADVLIVDAHMTFKKIMPDAGPRFVKRVLRNITCPIIAVPGTFEKIDDIIFAFDGHASSMFAIKQFTYLFPELSSHKLIVVHAGDNNGSFSAGTDQLKDWLHNHYASFVFKELPGKMDGVLLDYLSARKHAIVIMGAYGRSALSRMIRKSAADPIVKTLSQPLFIAH